MQAALAPWARNRPLTSHAEPRKQAQPYSPKPHQPPPARAVPAPWAGSAAIQRSSLGDVELTKAKFVKTWLDQVPAKRATTRLTAIEANGKLKLYLKDAQVTEDIAGRYAYVTLADTTIVLWRVVGDNDTFHRGLSNFAAAVRYAGELVLGADGTVEWWNNGSGNYKPPLRTANLAGLPLDKFEAHKESADIAEYKKGTLPWQN